MSSYSDVVKSFDKTLQGVGHDCPSDDADEHYPGRSQGSQVLCRGGTSTLWTSPPVRDRLIPPVEGDGEKFKGSDSTSPVNSSRKATSARHERKTLDSRPRVGGSSRFESTSTAAEGDTSPTVVDNAALVLDRDQGCMLCFSLNTRDRNSGWPYQKSPTAGASEPWVDRGLCHRCVLGTGLRAFAGGRVA